MNRLKGLVLSLTALACTSVTYGESNESVSGNYLNNRQPLLHKEYIALPLGAIKAEGWMAD